MNVSAPVNPFRKILVLFFAIGLVCSAIAAHMVVESRHILHSAAHAQGIVIALREGMYYKTWPIVAFRTASGEQIEFQGNVSSRSPYPVGTRLDVLYDKQHPSNARIASVTDLWGLPLCIGLMGLVFLAISSAMMFITMTRRERSIQNSGANPASEP